MTDSFHPLKHPQHVLVEQYLDALIEQRRLSPLTQRSYARDLHGLFVRLGEFDPLQVRATDVRAAASAMRGRGANSRSIARAISAWRGLFAWLGIHHGMLANPCAGIKAPKATRALPKALSPDSAAQLLDGAVQSGPDDAHADRDHAMLELFYSSGLRLAELHSLNLTDALAAIREGEVVVIGKGSKPRVVPVGSKARAALERWMAVRVDRVAAEESALFVSARGTRLAMRSIQARVEVRGRAVGLRVHPHVLRHSFASHVLQSSGDLRAVQEMLGHASIAATQVYTALDWQHLAKVYDAAHPRAKKK